MTRYFYRCPIAANTEEKPQPERVELSKLWVGWWKDIEGIIRVGDMKYPSLERAQKQLRSPVSMEGWKAVAITTADATSFVIGEGLE